MKEEPDTRSCHEHIAGVLLAGGRSRRMGGVDKSQLTICGQPMIVHAINRLRPQTKRLAINANGDTRHLAITGLPVIPDSIGDFAGPLAGILAGMRWAQRLDPAPRSIITVTNDTPFFPMDLVARLLASAPHENMIAIASRDGTLHPVFGLWPVTHADDLENWLQSSERRKVMDWVRRHEFAEVTFPSTDQNAMFPDPFFNVNTKADLERANEMARHLKETAFPHDM